MPDENLLATLEQSLRQARATRTRLAARLIELEAEAEKVRTELGEMDAIANQTEAAMFRIMSSMLNTNITSTTTPTDAEIEFALRHDARQEATKAAPAATMSGAAGGQGSVARYNAAPVHQHAELNSERFLDRTIPQAAALLLREAGFPLHVNEIYNRLLEGGFQFTGQNPTISIAVSLNRNGRFRKVAPGTFDLVMRDALQAV